MRENFSPPGAEDVRQFFETEMKDLWPVEAVRADARKFLSNYNGTGWVLRGGQAIIDWKETAKLWIERSLSGEFSSKPPPKKNGLIVGNRPGPDSALEIQALYKKFCDDELTSSLDIDPFLCDFLEREGLVKTGGTTREQAIEMRTRELIGSNQRKHLDLILAYEKKVDCDILRRDEVVLAQYEKRLAIMYFFSQQWERGVKQIFEEKEVEA